MILKINIFCKGVFIIKKRVISKEELINSIMEELQTLTENQQDFFINALSVLLNLKNV